MDKQVFFSVEFKYFLKGFGNVQSQVYFLVVLFLRISCFDDY